MYLTLPSCNCIFIFNFHRHYGCILTVVKDTIHAKLMMSLKYHSISPVHTCDLEHDSATIRWRTCVCSRWYIHTTRWLRRFDSGSFFFCLFHLHYPKILQAQPKMLEDCWSRLGLFMWWKKSSERNQRRSKIVEADAIRQKFQMWFKLRIAVKLRNNDVTIKNRSRITAESHFKSQMWTGLFIADP